jgi:NADPH:quinone reductase-like Zn-dependent oxidoreductase
MRAATIDRFGGPHELHIAEVEAPPLAPDGVLVRVAAAGVNPVDTKLRQGAQADSFPYIYPVILGWDAAGTIEQVGPSVTAFAEGNEVIAYCRKDFVGQGAYAELVTVPVTQVALRGELSVEQGAGLPLAGLTAYQALGEAIHLREGETLVVRGASGGVGSFAVQIALAHGARVIAIASASSEQYLRELGVQDFVDYEQDDLVEAIRGACPGGIDALLDLVGGEEELDALVATVKEGGRVASTLEHIGDGRWAQRSLSERYVYVRPDGAQLARLVELSTGGKLKVPIAEIFPLQDAARAHVRLEDGGTEGKLVLRVGN